MGLDRHLSPRAAEMRKATAKMMEDNYEKILEHNDATTFPFFLIDHIKAIGCNGLNIKGYGSPGLTTLESAAPTFEMARRDGSVSTFFLVHNSIGMAVVNALGDEEQKERLLIPGVKFERIMCFGLTEPLNGSDATGLRTTASKVEGGWRLNGQKRWIGNATFGDVIVWAKNTDDGDRIQAFYVEKGSPGFTATKIEGKYALRSTQNADIKIDNVFVPDHNKLTHSKDFATGTNAILESSRLMVAWMAVGVAVGAYEAAVKHALKRIQFGKPIAKFQLIQERLSRMLANCEFMLSHLVNLSIEFDKGTVSIGQIARAKANCTRLGREVVALAREVVGGNGIILENHVIKAFNDMEAMYTYEGTYDVNMLVSGRELTGGLSAIK
jgi:alkylation response protein AidB-like acyl-CoA dehydrogenase